MDIVSVCPLRIATLRWQMRPGTWVLTLVCKATLLLAPGESELADVQEEPNDDDDHWDDDPDRSVRFASDLAPYKAAAEVLVTGSAHAPRGAPVSSVHVRLLVGEIDKSASVCADRAWGLDGALREGPRFTKMSLRWERSAGGPGTMNPVGVAHDIPGPMGEIALPNVVPIGFVPSHRGERIEPIGFGPIAPSWPARREKLGGLAQVLRPRHLADAQVPPGVDAAFFLAAPRDQQMPALAEDAPIVLEHLHPQHPRLVTRLPGLRPRVRVERPGAGPAELPVRADTLAIDADRGLATIVWRGQLVLASRDEAGRALVAVERRGGPIARSPVADPGRLAAGAQPGAEAPPGVRSLSGDGVERADDTLYPPAQSAGGSAVETLFLMDAPPGVETLPFGQGAVVPDTLRRAEQAAAEIRAGVLPAGWAPPSPIAGASPLPAPRLPASRTTDRIPPVSSAPADATLVPGAQDGDAAPDLLPPPAHVHAAAPAPPVAPPAMIAARPVFLDMVEPPPPAPPPRPVEVAVAPVLVGATEGVKDAARRGVAGLSDAAAGAHGAIAAAQVDPRALEPPEERSAPEPRRPAGPSEAFELLWHAPDLAKKLRQVDEWRRMFLESDLEPPAEGEPEVMAEEDAETPDEADRRRIADALSRGAPVGIAAVREAVRRGVRPSGRFVAPVLLLDGELEISFDEVETLRAVTAAAAPFVPIDKRIKEAVDGAQEALRSSWIGGSGAAADTFTERVREAFAAMRREMPAGRRPIAADHLDVTAARALLSGRHHLKRPVYGEPHVRGALRFLGTEEKMPVYLKEDAARRLPIAPKLRVRLFAEVGARVDAGEASRLAGRAAAVAAAVAVE